MQPGTCFGFRHTVIAADVTANGFVEHTRGAQVTGAIIQWRTSAGVEKPWDGSMVVTSPEKITITEISASLVAGDTFDILLF